MNARHSPPRLVIVSGCSGGGKLTLAARGFATVAEPGRRIVAQQRAVGGSALPWIDPAGFARRLVQVARADLQAARSHSGVVIFDRGLIDAAAAQAHLVGIPVERTLRAEERFDPVVFLTPPWPEIYAEDSERRHGFAEASAEYERLVAPRRIPPRQSGPDPRSMSLLSLHGISFRTSSLSSGLVCVRA